MNSCRQTYCLVKGTGGIAMSDFDEITKSVSFLMDDNFRPGLILQLDGDIHSANELFKMHFDIKNKKNINEIIEPTSMLDWTRFAERAGKSCSMLMELMHVHFIASVNSPVLMNAFF